MDHIKNYPAITLVPVIEVDIKTFHPPSNSGEEFFISKYLELIKTGNYIETPDGWFFPLVLLREDLDAFSKYLLLEAENNGEFIISGGFQIWISDEYVPSVLIGTSFRFAMKLADWIIKKEKEQQKEIFIDNDNSLIFYIKGNELTIRIPQEQSKEINVSFMDFLQQCEYAEKITKEFAESLAFMIERMSNYAITATEVRRQFGLI